MPRIALNSRRSRTSCSLIALATVMVVGASPAAAQSFDGTGSFTFGTGLISTSPNTTSISVTSPSAVIDWSSTAMSTVNNGVPIVFQPAGTTANFSGGGNYAVLNRLNVVDSTRVIQLNGTIQTVASGALNGTGSIYFYSPSGFMLGGTSIINVPALVLSALPIGVDGSGNFITGVDRTVTFGPAVNANASITTNTGSQITGNVTGSYVALVAPSVVHHGTITTNGQAALVAAEAATINFSPDGLFDISVTTGTTSGSGIVVNGDITGQASTGVGDNNRIYMVAVPKNTAMTMLIASGADLGFNIAGAANVDGNAIVLSAGHNITDGAIQNAIATGGSAASMTIQANSATSALTARAADELRLSAVGTANYASDVHLRARTTAGAQATSSAASILNIAGDLTISSDANPTGNGTSATAGNSWLFSQNGGAVNVAGDVTITADAYGANSTIAGIASGSATGGSVIVEAEFGGSLTIGGNIIASAEGHGGAAAAAGVNAGNATGGSVRIGSWGNTGTSFSVTGTTTASADAVAGVGDACGGCNGTGGNATGGSIFLWTTGGSGATATFNGNVWASADAFGGNGGGTSAAGTGLGGNAGAFLATNSTLSFNGDLTLSAGANGGSAQLLGATGTGGTARISTGATADGATFHVGGNTLLSATGAGGYSSGSGTGGAGIGGSAYVQASYGIFDFDGSLTLNANAYGANQEVGNGGAATAGSANIFGAQSTFGAGATTLTAIGFGGGGETGGAGTGGTAAVNSQENVTITGDLTLDAGGEGGFGGNGNGGTGQGGSSTLSVTNGTLSVTDQVYAYANGTGGGSQDSGAFSGNGFGGTTTVRALTNGTLNITGSLQASADGFGGGNFGFGTNTGSGTGGDVFLQASGANAVVALGSWANVSANGEAGAFCGECGGGGLGGNGTGGSVTVQAFGANTASLTIAGSLNADANGQGGDGVTGNGGTGDGGSVYLGANDGADLHILGTLSASAEGWGGYSYGPGDGGAGTGGDVTLNATGGGTLDIDFGGYIDVDGYGGGAGISSTGDGGDGIGGHAGLYADGGAIDIGFLLLATAQGHGGYSDNAAGGDGFGTMAELFATNGGSVGIDGFLSLSVDGFGGSGVTGGSGTGGGEPDGEGSGTDGAHIFAKNGTVTITGTTDLSADGFGGSGDSGGAGGDAYGGWTTITAANSNGGPSNVTLAAVNISANATGGGGGQGTSGNQGGNGGAGGNALAGTLSVFANAGNGHLLATDVSASAIATGGQGGDGGNGDNLAGGNGGAGGNAEGGFAQVGTASGNGEAAGSNLGTATYGSISADTSATGGNGGAGNFGTPDGSGGAGGVGDGGTSLLLVRGSTVTVSGTTTLTSDGNGGQGGFGGGDFGSQGAGGDGFAGEVRVLSTSRFLIPAQQGTLNTGAITGSATGTGGLGSTNGSGIVEGGSGFIVDRSTVTIASLDFDVSGDEVDLGADPSRISITNGTVAVDGEFAFSTVGDLSFYIDNGSLTAGSLTLSAGNFVTDPDNPATVNRGTAFADSATITTGDDFIADADFDIGSSLVIDAPGIIAAHDFTIDGNLDLSANGGGLTADNLDVSGDINLYAFGAITLDTVLAGFFRADAGGTFDSNDITSDSDIRIFAGDDVTLGDLDAGLPAGESSKAVRIDTDGSILVGDIVALGGIDITAAGSVTGEDVTTGDGLFTDADGAISFFNISAGLVNPQTPSEPFSVALDSATSINVGNVDANQPIGFVTSGTLTTGNLTTDSDILGLAHGTMLIGNIDAGGRVFLADSSMFTTAGGTIGGQDDDGADIEAIFAATPVATNSSITVLDVLAGSFQAAPGTFFQSGDITTDGLLYIDAGTNITGTDFVAGDIFSPAAVNIEAGNNIQLGDVTSGESIGLTANGSITTDDLFAYGSITVDAGGAVDLGNVTTEYPPLLLFAEGSGGPVKGHSFGPSVEIFSDTSVTTLDIDSAEDVIIDSAGFISTGNITAAGWINLIADTDITTLDLTTDLDVNLDAGDDIAFADASVGTEFDFDAGGDVTSTGNMTAGNQISGEAGGAINLGNLTVTGGLAEGEDFSVGMTASGNITVLNVSATNPVGFGTNGNLATGNVSAGGLFMALVGGNTTTGSITTTGEGTGQVYIADDSMFAIGEVGEDDFNPNLVLALDPVATGGSITINGPVTTGLFRAAAGTGLTTQAMTADNVQASAGGTATLNGIWDVSDSVLLRSNDIDITGTGGIDAEGFLTLRSTNATQMLIGDGLTGTGYALSNAEFGRISGYEVELIGRSDASAAIDMLVGDLNVTGPLAGSNVEGSDLTFATYDFDSEAAPAGVIRVVGDVNATGFAANADQSVNFVTQRFELDAATGSVTIFSSGSTLGGELGLYANRIHVAAGSILDQLAVNPTYTGYQEDLNEAAAVQRPEGVLRADTLWIESSNLQDVLIQNTGTAATPAGFLVREALVNDDDEVAGPPNSINLVVNGQVVTEGGTLTGVAARDALVTPEDDITPFTSNSTINGCPLTGECIIRPPEPPPAANVVDNQIDLITSNPLGDSEFGNEPDIDDGEEGDEGANNPISPPQPLFDTRPLIPASEVNDPVSGTGNPALLGNDQCDAEDENQCPAKGDSQ